MITLTEGDFLHCTSRSPAGTPIVFVVDDDDSARATLDVLMDAAGWQPVTCASAEEFLAYPKPDVPSCLLLDMVVGDCRSRDLQKRIAFERPDMPVIVTSECRDIRLTVQAMKAGALEFLTKPLDDDAVLDAIGRALDRSRRLLEQRAAMNALRESYRSLTTREREVMVLVVSGLLNKQVGGELGISEITVKAHRGQVMRKMKAASLPALVHMASSLELTTAAIR